MSLAYHRPNPRESTAFRATLQAGIHTDHRRPPRRKTEKPHGLVSVALNNAEALLVSGPPGVPRRHLERNQVCRPRIRGHPIMAAIYEDGFGGRFNGKHRIAYGKAWKLGCRKGYGDIGLSWRDIPLNGVAV